MRVIVVCMDAVTRGVAEIILRGAGHEVVSASSAGEGLAELSHPTRRLPVELLLVDGALPASGTTALCRASLEPGAPWAVVLANDAEEAGPALAAGAIGVVAKPVERDGLMACLERVRPFVAAPVRGWSAARAP